MNPANYSKATIRAMMDVLPFGTIASIATKLSLPYSTVQNVCNGKQYRKDVVDEVEKRFKKVKKALTEQ